MQINGLKLPVLVVANKMFRSAC